MTSLDIAMPFYGDVTLMKQAVESVLGQSDPDWRLLVVDDAQPDESVAAWFTTLGDPRVQYHRNPTNLGITANFQRSLDLATADLVTFFGCDDRMLPTYVARARGAFDSDLADRIAVYQPRVKVIDQSGSVVMPLADRIKAGLRPHTRTEGLRRLQGESLVTRLMHGNWTYFPSLCWRRTVVEQFGFEPRYSVVQDLRLLVDAALEGYALLLDDEVTFEYRRHAASVSSVAADFGDRFDEETRFFVASATRLDAHGWPRAARAARWHVTSRLHRRRRQPRHRPANTRYWTAEDARRSLNDSRRGSS